MILYGDARWESPYFFSAFVALKEKGLPFETRTLDVEGGETRRSPYRELSLTARIPALDHEGFVVSESAAIVEYVEEAFPSPSWPSLLPQDVRRRARARQIMGWVRSDLLPLREERPTSTIFFERKATAPLSAAARAAADKLLAVAGRVLPDGATSLFDRWCIADADLCLVLQRLVANGDPVPDSIRRYTEAQWERPSFQAFVRAPRSHP